MHIVLVEDDEVIRETTQIGLERFDYTVSAFADGREGYEFVAAHGADVLLLDLMLPTMNGASICRAVRERSTIPIIIISARSDAIDIVQALEAGADDYLTKPFDMQVLNARIRAVVRRFITTGTDKLGYSPSAELDEEHETVIGPGGMITGDGIPEVLGASPGMDTRERLKAQLESDDTYLGAGGKFTSADMRDGSDEQMIGDDVTVPPRPDGSPAMQASSGQGGYPGAGENRNGSAGSDDELGPFRTRLGSLVLDTGRLTVEIDGEEVHLTPTELRVLLLLTEQPEHVYSREKIAFTVWGYEWAGDSRVVDVHIQRLRKKIGANMIETVRGFGYRFAG
ncbi:MULTISPECIES: response regulator transcription factor [unclassified Brevibacterium]|uniref:response regulator transcription factor n=1 Tax=unclassified Brevibacterium TaxID=2614124 RepID=UPI000C38F9AA|nr:MULTISPECIES: response regulator transcription factor [unclassified Brevibacterium]SMX83620.1 Transcriptional regulatory protein, C terminal [Brevibacterium sp. 239c]